MAYPEFIELFDSGAGSLAANDDGTLTRDVSLKWLVSNKAGYLEAEEWGLGMAPEIFQGHRRQNLVSRPLGNKWWEIEAAYTNKAINSDGGEGSDNGGGGSDPIAHTVAFDTTGATEHITSTFLSGSGGQQGETVHTRPGETENIVYFDGAINVQGDSVQGVDIVVPQFNFTETWTMPSSWILNSYVEKLYKLTGTVNKSQFRCFKQGECLFLGARCEMTRGSSLASVTYQFAARPTRENFKVGAGSSAIEVNFKRGWEYMWVRYGKSVSSNTLIQRPLSVHVNAIYELEDFAALSIGTKFPTVYQPKSVWKKAS
jgi:hypothetical protein